MNVDEHLHELAKQISVCTKCELFKSRVLAVPGEGPGNARIMLIGEGPGFHENKQGRPFVGAAGKFLDELLSHANVKREDVFITNVVKCRPPGNRDPQIDELEACDAYLDAQINWINPSIIVTLGRFSMAKFFGNVKISQIHGQAKLINGRLIVAMFHPAAALHQPGLKNTVIADFQKLPEFLKKMAALTMPIQKQSDQQPETKSGLGESTQLSLFNDL